MASSRVLLRSDENQQQSVPTADRQKLRSPAEEGADKDEERGKFDLPLTIDALLHNIIINDDDDDGSVDSDSAGDDASRPTLQSALGISPRMKSLARANKTFHHDDVVAHDDEVRAGAMDSLVWRLGYCIGLLAVNSSLRSSTTSSNNEAHIWQELSDILSTLSQVCKCSESLRVSSFKSVGKSQLFPFLVHVLDVGVPFLARAPEVGKVSNVVGAILGSLRILRSYAKVVLIRPVLLQSNSPTVHLLLKTLADLLALRINGLKRIRSDVLGLLKDASHRCSDVEANLLVKDHECLLTNALIVVKETTSSCNKEYGATLLWNLASRRSARLGLVSLSCDGEVGSLVLCTLSRMISQKYDDGSTTVNSNIQSAALSALGNLARGGEDEHGNAEKNSREADDKCKNAILLHENGSIIDRLLSVSLSDSDGGMKACTASRRRAVRTIRCLVNNPLVMSTNSVGVNLVAKMSKVMRNDEDSNVRVQAAESLKLLYQSQSNDRNLNEVHNIKRAFIEVVLALNVVERDFAQVDGTEENCAERSFVAETSDMRCALIACEALVGRSRQQLLANLLMDHPLVFESLVKLLLVCKDGTSSTGDDSKDAKLTVLKLLHALSKNESNRFIMLQNEASGVKPTNCSEMLNTLAETISYCDASGDGNMELVSIDLRTCAAAIVVELSREEPQSRRNLLDHPTLLPAFMIFCKTVPDGLRDEAKAAALRLVSSM